jgi:hypothetical protein
LSYGTQELAQLLGNGRATSFNNSLLVFVLIKYQLQDSQLQAHQAFKITYVEFGKPEEPENSIY